MTKRIKVKCRYCDKSTGVIKYYVIADNLEEPKPHHKKCIDELYRDVMLKIAEIEKNNPKNGQNNPKK